MQIQQQGKSTEEQVLQTPLSDRRPASSIPLAVICVCWGRSVAGTRYAESQRQAQACRRFAVSAAAQGFATIAIFAVEHSTTSLFVAA